MQLQTVQVVFRHGDRTPITPFFQDDGDWNVCPEEHVLSYKNSLKNPRRIDIPPHKHNNMWKGNCNTGQLTLRDSGYNNFISITPNCNGLI